MDVGGEVSEPLSPGKSSMQQATSDHQHDSDTADELDDKEIVHYPIQETLAQHQSLPSSPSFNEGLEGRTPTDLSTYSPS